MSRRDRLPERLRGIVPPMLTPLRDRDELDHEGLARLVTHILGGGVSGLFVLGTTGEGPSLGYRLRYELLERVCELVDGHVPVLVGISDTSFVESLELAQRAGDEGAAAVVAAPPYYFPMGQNSLERYFRELADESPLPVFLYNMPSCTKVAIGPQTLERLMQHPNIAGIKDSSGDLDYFRRALELRGTRADWSVLVGPEHLLAETAALGADGGVCGGANLHPRLFVELFAAAVRKDTSQVEALQAEVLRLGRIYEIGAADAAVPRSLKCGLGWLGICSERMAEPFRALDERDRGLLIERLQELAIAPVYGDTDGSRAANSGSATW